MIRTPPLRSVAAVLFTLTVLSTIDQPFSARADDKRDATAAKIKQLEDKIAALEANQQKLLKRLEDLEYPELRHRDADEIRLLKRRAYATKAVHDRIEAFSKAKVIGGETLLLVSAAYHTASAHAELAWAEGRTKDAVRHTAEAAVYAEERLRQAEIIFQAGVQKVGSVVLSGMESSEAIEARAHAQKAMFRALAVADHAKVDVSDMKIEVPSARAIHAKSLNDVLELLRVEPAPDRVLSSKKE